MICQIFIKIMNKINQAIVLLCLVSAAMFLDYSVQNQLGEGCKNGQKNPPFNINSKDAGHCKSATSFQLKSTNGNYTQIAYDSANTNLKTPFNLSTISITKNGVVKDFTAVQFHFHHKSQHQINGKDFDIELQVVHQADDNSLAVFSVLFQYHKGKFSDPFDDWHLNTATPVDQPFPINLATPEKVYNYKGALTAPACNQNVQWFINEEIVKVKQSSIDLVAGLLNEGKHGKKNNLKAHDKNKNNKNSNSEDACLIHRPKEKGSKERSPEDWKRYTKKGRSRSPFATIGKIVTHII